MRIDQAPIHIPDPFWTAFWGWATIFFGLAALYVYIFHIRGKFK